MAKFAYKGNMMARSYSLFDVYTELLEHYGKQGWWPIGQLAGSAGFDSRGYHPGIYTIPQDDHTRWEILCGAILTQNTAWSNVEKALALMHVQGLDKPEDIISIQDRKLAEIIRPSGYFNQKTLRLKMLARYIIDISGKIPERDDLLELKGIGPETADSMLLYGWHEPFFVVDAYTIRLLCRIGLADQGFHDRRPEKRYQHVQNFITFTLGLQKKRSQTQKATLYKEFHALIVKNAKEHCAKKPVCGGCPLEHGCKKMI